MDTERINFVKVGAGLCFVALGILLLLERSGFVQFQQIVRFWPLALVVLGGALAWQASRGESTGGAAPGLIWLLILGLAFNHVYDRRARLDGAETAGAVNVFSMMTDNRPVPQGTFTGGQVTTIMGRTGLDLRSVVVPPGEPVVVDLFTMMGGTDIYVPADWQVDVRSTAVAAGVRDRRGEQQPDRDNRDEAAAESGADAPVPAAPAPDVAAPNAPAPSVAGPDVPAPSASAPRVAAGASAAAGPPPRLILQGFVLFGGVTVRQ